MGPVFEDAQALLAEAGSPLIAVGDVVTYHLEVAGRSPDVSIVDELTERSAVDDRIQAALGEPDVMVENPAATLTEELLSALVDAVASAGPVRILVDGEEDLATLPALVAVPDGASVVYGQPGAGMVLVEVTSQARDRAVALLRRMEGDIDRAMALLSTE